MASVNWEKGKSKAQIKAVLRHCQTDERLKNKHSNLDIDKSLTAKNTELSRSGYTAVCKAFDDRLADIDSKATKTPRKDRVECLFLDIPAPENLAEQATQEWFKDVHSRLCDRFGKANVIMATVHYDEIHAYTDATSGETRLSRPHMHVALIPEIDGRLCAKQVSSRQNMVGLNNDIDRLSRQKYGVDFMDGSKRKSHDSVEGLKNQSLKKENEQLRAENVGLDISIKRRKKALESLDEQTKQAEQKRSTQELASQRIQEQIQAQKQAWQAQKQSEMMELQEQKQAWEKQKQAEQEQMQAQKQAWQEYKQVQKQRIDEVYNGLCKLNKQAAEDFVKQNQRKFSSVRTSRLSTPTDLEKSKTGYEK